MFISHALFYISLGVASALYIGMETLKSSSQGVRNSILQSISDIIEKSRQTGNTTKIIDILGDGPGTIIVADKSQKNYVKSINPNIKVASITERRSDNSDLEAPVFFDNSAVRQIIETCGDHLAASQ